MRVFLSWSGDRSRQLAAELRDWIPLVIQAAQPWMSQEDIEKGDAWFSAIRNELSSSDVGLILVTPENQHSQWLNFEAGALSREITAARVCPLLLDLDGKDLTGPLTHFNWTRADSGADVLRLFMQRKPDSLSESVLRKSFDTFWPTLQKTIERLAADRPDDVPAGLDEGDKLDEILSYVRSQQRSFASLAALSFPTDSVTTHHLTSSSVAFTQATIHAKIDLELRTLLSALGYRVAIAFDAATREVVATIDRDVNDDQLDLLAIRCRQVLREHAQGTISNLIIETPHKVHAVRPEDR